MTTGLQRSQAQHVLECFLSHVSWKNIILVWCVLIQNGDFRHSLFTCPRCSVFFHCLRSAFPQPRSESYSRKAALDVFTCTCIYHTVFFAPFLQSGAPRIFCCLREENWAHGALTTSQEKTNATTWTNLGCLECHPIPLWESEATGQWSTWRIRIALSNWKRNLQHSQINSQISQLKTLKRNVKLMTSYWSWQGFEGPLNGQI